MARNFSLEGLWEAKLTDGSVHAMHLPGTLDENRIGQRDTGANQWKWSEEEGMSGRIATRFTRKYVYEGPTWISRRVSFAKRPGTRVFLEAERARCLRLLVNGQEAAPGERQTISTPHVFEVTNLLSGDDAITLVSDNSYPGLPHDDIVSSSAATDETQTNWNGVLGYIRLREEAETFLACIRALPHGQMLDVEITLDSLAGGEAELHIESDALAQSAESTVSFPAGRHTVWLRNLPLRTDVRRWDEDEGNLYAMTVRLGQLDEKTVCFGVRDFGDNGSGRLALNGRVIFLRSEANCAEFPETGHPPMDVERWTAILETYRSYGVNCMRFHSHCPPEAAFFAADNLGMLMQPELSHWNPRNALETDESYAYYRAELLEIIRTLANHPSFVMATLGNELWTGETGHKRMSAILEEARALDPTRLYANGSNVHYGQIGCDPDSDFYTSSNYGSRMFRGISAGSSRNKEERGLKPAGYINNCYPNAITNYDETMGELRKSFAKPVYSFEVGQFEVLPEFTEFAQFHGISDPDNYRIIQQKVLAGGIGADWPRYVRATGELSRIGYREEIEAALRTKELSGISLLSLQDFPGQGTALVGMLNSHLQPKPYAFAQPEAFRRFFTAQLPLVLLPRYTYTAGERLCAQVRIANYGKRALAGELCWSLSGNGWRQEGSLPQANCPVGTLCDVGELDIALTGFARATRLDLTVGLDGAENCYPVWVYPQETPACPENVYETRTLDEKALAVLSQGGRVYLAPDSTAEAIASSVQAQFTTDFWSVGTFEQQTGCMGQLIDAAHPLFADFPTEEHTNWQWWPMASQRAAVLPQHYEAIITEMDSYAYMRPMAQMLECRCAGGTLLFSTLGLHALQQYPEARALQGAIYRYMASDAFRPAQEMGAEALRNILGN